jgi:hypothetical protein
MITLQTKTSIDAVTLSDYTGTNWYPYDEDGGAIHAAGETSQCINP